MEWSNFPRLALEKSLQELAVLLSVLGWVILRVSGAVVKRLSEGKNLRVEVFGKEVLEVESSNSDPQLTAENILKILAEEENKKNHILQGKEKTLLKDAFVTQKTINHMLFSQMEEQDLLAKSQLDPRESEKEVNIKNGSSSSKDGFIIDDRNH